MQHPKSVFAVSDTYRKVAPEENGQIYTNPLRFGKKTLGTPTI